MKILSSFFVAALCVSTCGIAQTTSGSESEYATATYASMTTAGTMTVTTAFPTSDGAKPTKGTRATYEIFILRSGTGQVEYSLNISSIKLDDPDHLTDGVSTPDLFNFFGREAVRQGIAYGYTPVSSVCSGTVQGTVSAEYYVTRTGTGSATRFTPYSTQTKVFRGYSACMESGSVSPTVSLVTATTKSSSASYEGTIE